MSDFPCCESTTDGTKEAIDWDDVERTARDAYHADSTVIDRNDFVAGYKAAVQQSAARIKFATEVALKLGREEMREEHATACGARAQEAYERGIRETAERIAVALEHYQHALEEAFEARGWEADEIRADAAENCVTIARDTGKGDPKS